MKGLIQWLAMRLGNLRDYFNNNESTVVYNLSRILALVCLVVMVLYAVIFMRQFNALMIK